MHQCCDGVHDNPQAQCYKLSMCILSTVAPMYTCALLIRWWAKAKHSSTADPISSPMIASGSMTSTATVFMAATNQPLTAPLFSSRHAELRQRLLVTLVTVSFYYYPSLLTTSLSLFACYRIDPIQAQMGQSYPQNAQACPSIVSTYCMFIVWSSVASMHM